MERHFIRGLSLNSTYLSSPTNASTSIIPYNRTWSLYDWDLQDEAPSGGYYTTINDLRKIGLAMMNSTQLDRHVTRRWFKPMAFTASSTMATGLPWEIVLAPNTSSRLWMYTKYGNLGAYSSYIILIPDLGMGVSVLTAGVASLPAAQGMSNIISSIMVPAMEQVAKEEANTTYSGTYRSANGSITILTDNGPGLLVQNDTFTWNGSNMGSTVAILDRVNNNPFEIRLWPTTQMAELDNGGYATAWRAVIQALPVVENPLPFPGDCNSWFHVDEITYGGVGLDDFVFLLESKEGNANALMPKFLRTTYKR